VVMPSGSCAAFLRVEYPHLFDDKPGWRVRAEQLSAKTYELSEYLVNVAGWAPAKAANAPCATYHDSCHANRMLGLGGEARALLAALGCEIIEMDESDRCCGFGGIFCAKMPEVSNAMTADKLRRAGATGADVLVTIDPGCLMQIRGMMRDEPFRAEHLATVLDACSG
jgi:L-lactate dehydrogenase complex protein LldE